MARGKRSAPVIESVLSIDEQIVQLQEKKIEDHRKEEAKRIEDTECASCGSKLNLNAEEYMQPGTKRETVECSSCEILNDVIIAYPGNGKPDTDNCKIEVIKGGYKWQQSGVVLKDLSDKQVKAWYDNERKAVIDGTSKLPFEMQVIMRMMK